MLYQVVGCIFTVDSVSSWRYKLKQKLHLNQQRATLCSRAAEEADKSRSEAEKNQTRAEARALESKGERDAALADKLQVSEELQNLIKEVHNHL